MSVSVIEKIRTKLGSATVLIIERPSGLEERRRIHRFKDYEDERGSKLRKA